MGLLMKLFGQKGVIKYSGVTYDGVEFTGKNEIEMFACDEEHIIKELKNALWVENDLRVKDLKIIGFYKT